MIEVTKYETGHQERDRHRQQLNVRSTHSFSDSDVLTPPLGDVEADPSPLRFPSVQPHRRMTTRPA